MSRFWHRWHRTREEAEEAKRDWETTMGRWLIVKAVAGELRDQRERNGWSDTIARIYEGKA